MTEPAFKTVAETVERLKKWTAGHEDVSWAVVEADDPSSPVLYGRGAGGEGSSFSTAYADEQNTLTPNPSPVKDGSGERALGRVALFTSGRDVWEVGCMIVPAARGKNLAARALGPAIDFVFETKGARRIFADVDPDNIPSLRVFEKLGFQREGVLRGNWQTHIGVRDSVIFGLLRDDPRPWR